MAGVSTLGQALRQIENIKAQQTAFSELSVQLATGKKSENFSGLKTDALTSLRARDGVESLDTYLNNILKANIRIELMLDTIEEQQAQTSNLADTLLAFVQEGGHQEGDDVVYDDPATTVIEETVVGKTSARPDIDFRNLQNQAENLFDFMVDLLNTKDGDRYILAGSDSFTKPITDSGTLDAAVSTLLTSWKNGTITTDELIADINDRDALSGNPDALTDTIIGYSSSLSSGNTGDVFVRVDDDKELKYTALANEDPFRNIMVALAVLKNDTLPPVLDVYENGVFPGIPDELGAPGADKNEMQDNFYRLYNEIVKMVVHAIDDVDEVRFRLETTRAQAAETKEKQILQKNFLLTTISNVEDVDINNVAVKLQAVQTQLETSYRVTAITSQLSLVNFL
ncbi:MAG: flagellin [Alphaproteobacteria bacterium]|nr:flagellin [Alphaproteobacteria bacterium]